jgi:hypothetical protein
MVQKTAGSRGDFAMNVIYYDHQFNQNEWFVLTLLTMSILTVMILPKRFPPSITIIYLLVGVFLGMLLDHTISIKPIDFYDVNDSSNYQLFDFLTYVMYGPFGYFIIYFHDKFTIKGYANIFYILGWSSVALILEWTGVQFGVFHYKDGYKILFSFPIYLVVQSIVILFYLTLKRKYHYK